jgi:hypothetical protein
MCIVGNAAGEGAVMRVNNGPNYRLIVAALYCIGFWVLAIVLVLRK